VKKNKKFLSPGSDAAVKSGCLCPVMDNHRGSGYMGMPHVFVMQEDCPLHGSESRKTWGEKPCKKASLSRSRA